MKLEFCTACGDEEPAKLVFHEIFPAAVAGEVETNLRTLCRLCDSKLALRLVASDTEEANRARSGYLAAASHDVRQPLYALSLFLETLKNRPHDEKSRTVIERMEETLDVAKNLIDTTLDLSKFDSTAILPAYEMFPIQAV